MNRGIEELLGNFHRENIEQVFSYSKCDIDNDFIGFIRIYKHISYIIPKHFTVIDFGCAYAPQCGYFRNHRKYIGVDISECNRFYLDNTEHHQTGIASFIDNNIQKYDLDETFAICSYVPSEDEELVRKNFKNCFSFYPSNKEGQNYIYKSFLTKHNQRITL